MLGIPSSSKIDWCVSKIGFFSIKVDAPLATIVDFDDFTFLSIISDLRKLSKDPSINAFL